MTTNTAARAYARQGRHLPDATEYVGRCQSCRRKFCWPRTAVTAPTNNTAHGRRFTCPVCDAADVIQTSRVGSTGADFLHLYEHQVANLQVARAAAAS